MVMCYTVRETEIDIGGESGQCHNQKLKMSGALRTWS